MHFAGAMILTTIALIVFCFGLPGGIQFAGSNTFVPGLAGIFIFGVAMGVLGLQWDRKTRGE
jgi:hypothetical protein